MAGEARDPRADLAIVSLLSEYLLNICVYTRSPGPLSNLVREVSFFLQQVAINGETPNSQRAESKQLSARP